ncbi:7631_t:CDS:2, partial [Entrophospora sp. SA101]
RNKATTTTNNDNDGDDKNKITTSQFHKKLLILVAEEFASTGKKVFVNGMEVYEYYDLDKDLMTIYISKVDTTENPNKNILNDTDLLRWWKNTLKVLNKNSLSQQQIKVENVNSWFFIPGVLSKREARLLIKDANNNNRDDDDSFWIYDYPYSDNDNAIDVIPIFEDDPKSRWINKKNDKNEKNSELKVKMFWELLAIGTEFATSKNSGFFWLEIDLGERSKNGNDGDQGCDLLDEETFIMLKNGLLLKDFGNETLSIESTASWINYFDELLSNGINNKKTSFTVEINNQIEDQQEQQNNIGTSSTTPSSQSQLRKINNLVKRKSTTISSFVGKGNEEDKSSNINILSTSLIKRVKKN